MKSKYVLYLFLRFAALNAAEYVLYLIMYIPTIAMLFALEINRAMPDDLFKKVNSCLKHDGLGFVTIRLIIYSPLWIIVTACFYREFEHPLSIRYLSIYNCTLYVILSLIVGLFFPGAYRIFLSPAFVLMVVCTSSSPFIVSKIPLVKYAVTNFNNEASKLSTK